MAKNLPKLFIALLGFVFIINLLQAYFTPIIFDEAYYWHYAQTMDWGYFDHPPMVALMVKLSAFLFNEELGVRFISCMFSVAIPIILWLTIDLKEKTKYIKHFFVVIFSMTLLNAYGFLTLPDTPLLFFTALFLYFYKRFLSSSTIAISIALGLCMAALMYSKYHAVLVIFFVILSNLKLLTNKRAWLAVCIALLCYIPHFLWLYDNDFVSIKYHLFERPNAAYNFMKYTVGYFVNLIAIFGLTFPLFYKALIKSKAEDLFKKSLLYLIYGVLIFFFISSFNRRVQTQWIIIISIPMVLLVFEHLIKNDQDRKWIWRLGLTNIVVLFILRIGLIYKPLFPIYYETHGNKEWVKLIEKKAGNKPVVFENSYRNAPMYAFYTGKTSYSLNNINYRQNQYTIDNSEIGVQHKDVLYVSKYLKNADYDFAKVSGTMYFGNELDNFESFRKLRCLVEDEPFSLDNSASYKVSVYNPYDKNIQLDKLKFAIAYLNEAKQFKELIPIHLTTTNDNIKSLKQKDTIIFTFNLPKPNKIKIPRYFKIVISENGLRHGLNSETIKLE